jgi:4-methylaminobutanoate oxidase (formaldehyde-forming)
VYVYDALLAAAAALNATPSERGPRVTLRPVGLKALGSLRLEKGYRDYGHDLDNTDSLAEAGLAFTAAWAKPLGFVGQAAAEAQRARGVAGLQQRLLQVSSSAAVPLGALCRYVPIPFATIRIAHALVCLPSLIPPPPGPPSHPPSPLLLSPQVQLLDPSPLLFHGEVVYRNGSVVGDVRSGSYGHSVGGAVGLAMVSCLTNGQPPLTAKAVAADVWEVDVAGVRHPAKSSLKPLFDPTNARIKA